MGVPPIHNALADCPVVFSPTGRRALVLANCRKALAAKNGGCLHAGDEEMLLEICVELGLPETTIRFVMGDQ